MQNNHLNQTMSSKALLEKLLYADAETDSNESKDGVKTKYKTKTYRMQGNYGETKFIKP